MEEQKTEIKRNVKPHIANRIISGLIDICLVFILFFVLYSLFLKTSLVNPMEKYMNICVQIQDDTKVETGFGYRVYEFEESPDYQVYTDAEGKNYIVKQIELSTEPTQEEKDNYQAKKDAYHTKLNESKAFGAQMFNYKLCNYGLVCLALAVSEAIFYLIIPLCDYKKQRTLGKMLAKTQLYSIRFENYAKWYHTVGRFFWIYIMESAIPFIIFNDFTLIIMPLLVLILMSVNSSNRAPVDFVTGTRVIEVRSFTPLVDHEKIANEDLNLKEKEK